MNFKSYFVVQPYDFRNGRLVPLEPIQVRDGDQAKRLARTLNCAGAIAFSRTGDPDLGEWEDAVILLTVGQIPEEPDEQEAA